MDTGLVLALISSVSFAIGIVLVRKTAGEAGEAFSVTALSIFTGVVFFTIAIFVSGDWTKLQAISWRAPVFLAIVGIIHFIIGRLLAYESYRLIGANRATPFNQTSPIYTMVLSLIFLKEQITVYIIIGMLCMLAGVFLISQERGSIDGDRKKDTSGRVVKGILLALGAALCWGITPILIKPSVEDIGSSADGAFISYVTAAIVMGMLLLNRPRRKQIRQLSLKKSILPMALAGVFTAGGQFLYYAALGQSPANVIAPLLSIQVVFIFFLSLLINRKIELFTPRIIFGMVAAVVGTFLLFH
ncbi:MAG: DMT family transporter [Dehalococcoidales bacterium]